MDPINTLANSLVASYNHKGKWEDNTVAILGNENIPPSIVFNGFEITNPEELTELSDKLARAFQGHQEILDSFYAKLIDKCPERFSRLKSALIKTRNESYQKVELENKIREVIKITLKEVGSLMITHPEEVNEASVKTLEVTLKKLKRRTLLPQLESLFNKVNKIHDEISNKLIKNAQSPEEKKTYLSDKIKVLLLRSTAQQGLASDEETATNVLHLAAELGDFAILDKVKSLTDTSKWQSFSTLRSPPPTHPL